MWIEISLGMVFHNITNQNPALTHMLCLISKRSVTQIKNLNEIVSSCWFTGLKRALILQTEIDRAEDPFSTLKGDLGIFANSAGLSFF